MLRSRFIPVLLLQGSGLIKTKQFKKYKYLGDIINVLKIFNEKKVDELCIFDLSIEPNKDPNFKLLENVARQANMPLCYGGGVTSLDNAKRLVSLGYEKVSISRASFSDDGFIEEVTSVLGAQSVVITLDVRKSIFGKYQIYTDRGKKRMNVDLFKHIEDLCNKGIGEICINNIDRDGMRNGYDLNLAKKINNLVNIPQTYVGGCGGEKDLIDLVNLVGPVGAGVGSKYVFKGEFDAVLINYFKA